LRTATRERACRDRPFSPRWLADIRLSWERIGVDFPTAQHELEQQSPGVVITVSQLGEHHPADLGARRPSGLSPKVTRTLVRAESTR
jgi:hypothetical protein